MFTTFIISFREFFEIFLIISVFFGLSKQLQLKKEKEIILASLIGVAVSFFLPSSAFLVGNKVRLVFNEQNVDMLEGYLMIFSGIFIAYVVLSLHTAFQKNRNEMIEKTKVKFITNAFDISLFGMITFLILREGFEIAFFTATTSLYAVFIDNLIGLLFGFFASLIIGALGYFSFVQLPLAKIFKTTEVLIILLGAAMINNGVSALLDVYFNFQLSDLLTIHLPFIPEKTSLPGHFLQTMLGMKQNFGLLELCIIGTYFFIAYQILTHNAVKKVNTGS